jgi:hypothetical protein
MHQRSQISARCRSLGNDITLGMVLGGVIETFDPAALKQCCADRSDTTKNKHLAKFWLGLSSAGSAAPKPRKAGGAHLGEVFTRVIG